MNNQSEEGLKATIQCALVETFEARTGFQRQTGDDGVVEAYYGGHWITLDTAPFAEAVLSLSRPTSIYPGDEELIQDAGWLRNLAHLRFNRERQDIGKRLLAIADRLSVLSGKS